MVDGPSNNNAKADPPKGLLNVPNKSKYGKQATPSFEQMQNLAADAYNEDGTPKRQQSEFSFAGGGQGTDRSRQNRDFSTL